MHSEMVRRTGSAECRTAMGRLSFSMTTSAPARTRVRSVANSFAASNSEIWITFLSIKSLYTPPQVRCGPALKSTHSGMTCSTASRRSNAAPLRRYPVLGGNRQQQTKFSRSLPRHLRQARVVIVRVIHRSAIRIRLLQQAIQLVVSVGSDLAVLIGNRRAPLGWPAPRGRA